MNKLTDKFQKKYAEKYQQFVYNDICKGISKNVKLHEEIMHPRSSAAACLNVLVYLNRNKKDIVPFFNKIGLNIQKVIDFPQNVIYGDEKYDDEGPIVFEWIGPKKSPINEGRGGGRGYGRTSIDGYMLAEVNGKITQLLIEWKFTEVYNSDFYARKFGGKYGVERLRRYSDILKKLRRSNFPFEFEDEGKIGLSDFSYEPFYQLLRMTLLAEMTTPADLGPLRIEDYKIIHLTHSENDKLNFLSKTNLKYSPGIKRFNGSSLHDSWLKMLEDEEKERHIMDFWNKVLNVLTDSKEKKYLVKRYE